MTKNFNDLYKEIVQEMVTAPQNQQQQPAQNQQQQPAQNQQQQPNSNRLQAITTALNQLKDPAHLDAVEKLLASLNIQKPNNTTQPTTAQKPNAVPQQA